MTQLTQLVVLSLEPWDDVWRRNQLLAKALIADIPDLRVLFVAPPLPALRNLPRGGPARAAWKPIAGWPGVTALTTVQWMPDRFSPYVAPRAGRSVMRATHALRIDKPVLWVNNYSLARFAMSTGWPVVYDITDDWLLAHRSTAKHRRATLDDELLMRGARAVVVCSPALAASRGKIRDVVLIPNGVDLARFTAPQTRPEDLGAGPVAVYIGTLHDDRLDVELCSDLARTLADVQFVYVGPDCLTRTSRDALTVHANVRLLGPRPHATVPAYLQHADAVFIPHVVSPFTESLDPIKARECLAVGTPTVATAIAGFRNAGAPIRIADAEHFSAELRDALHDRQRTPQRNVWTWTDAAHEFRKVLERVNID